MAEFTVTPWEVSGDIDYDKLVKQFGTQVISEELLEKLKKPLPALIRRGWYFSHRDLDKFVNAHAQGKKVSIVSGRGPSQKMHIGHLVPFLVAKYFQDAYDCNVYLPISDDEKYFVKPNLSFDDAEKHAQENILDLIALGFNPKKTKIHRDFEYTKIYKYAAKIAKHTTYSTAKAIFGLKPEQNIGWSFYPAIQSAHILLPQFLEGPHTTLVPVAIDQDPYMRVVRDTAEHPEIKLIKPGAIHAKFLPALGGTGKASSSSSQDHMIWLSDSEKEVKTKINKYAFSGGQSTVEEHRKKGGNPAIDIAYQLLTIFEDDDKKLKKIHDDYKSGVLLTGELKQLASTTISSFLERHQKNRLKAEKQVDQFMMRE